jgi:hypothetical protein
LKTSKEIFYALKVFPKLDITDSKNDKYGYMNYEHVEKIKKFKKIGLLGNHCRFIVETIATFENNVSNFNKINVQAIFCSFS